MIVRGPQLRSGCDLRVGLAALVRLVGPVAEKLGDSMLVVHFTCIGVVVHMDPRHVCAVVPACFNVELWPCPAYGGRIYTQAAWADGLKSVGERAGLV